MKKHIRLSCILLGFLLVCSCASQQTPPTPDAGYEKDAIKLTLKSDPKLNYNAGMPHSLSVCVYQLKDPNGFNQLAGDDDGLYELLECSLFDPGVLMSKRLTVHPGQDLEVSLDRAADAKYVAIVAGFYTIQKDRMTRLFEIPVVTRRKGVLLKKHSELGYLDVELILGPKQIHASHTSEGND